MPLVDLPASERPRERLLREGPGSLSDTELLALVLGTGSAGHELLATAQALLERVGDLRRLASAGTGELCQIDGIGVAQACRIRAALALAGRLADRPIQRGERIGSAADVYARLGRRLLSLEHEVFLAVALDVKNRVLAELRVADGGVCSVEVVPRDVFAALVREAPAAVLFLHNHPSGDPTPSQADQELTERLSAAGMLLGIRVLDHIIVGQDGYYTFAEDRFVGQGERVR